MFRKKLAILAVLLLLFSGFSTDMSLARKGGRGHGGGRQQGSSQRRSGGQRSRGRSHAGRGQRSRGHSRSRSVGHRSRGHSRPVRGHTSRRRSVSRSVGRRSASRNVGRRSVRGHRSHRRSRGHVSIGYGGYGHRSRHGYYYGRPYYRYRYYGFLPHDYYVPYGYYGYRGRPYWRYEADYNWLEEPEYEQDYQYDANSDRFAEARERYEKERAAAKERERRYIEVVARAFKSGDWEEAVARAKEGLLAEPESSRLGFLYSQSLFASGRYTSAAGVLRQSVMKMAEKGDKALRPLELYSGEDVLIKQVKALRYEIKNRSDKGDLELLLGYELWGLYRYDEASKTLAAVVKDDYVNGQAAGVLMSMVAESKRSNEKKEGGILELLFG